MNMWLGGAQPSSLYWFRSFPEPGVAVQDPLYSLATPPSPPNPCLLWPRAGSPVLAIVSVQSLCHVWLFAAPWTAECQASLSFTISLSLIKLMSSESGMPSNHLILCRPLLLLPSVFSSLRVFSNELALCIGGQSIGASPSAPVLPTSIQLDWLVWSPCSPRSSQESSPAPQFESINSLAISSLYGQLSHPY